MLLVDGTCALCGRLTRLAVALDRRRRLRFAALASPPARAILARHGALPPGIAAPSGASASAADTFRALVDQGLPGERLLARSDAALHVARELGPPWSALAVLALVPRRWRDGLYDLVARHRRRLGRGACPLPRASEAWRFLDAEPSVEAGEERA